MKILKRVVLLLLTLALMLSMVPVGFADEITEDDVYVLQRAKEDNSTGPNLQYSSPFTHLYKYNAAEKVIQSMLYSMQVKNSDGNVGKVFPTYCLDINTGAYGGALYRRLNLEDSSYSSSVAGMIRAILKSGFYILPPDAGDSAEVFAKVKELGDDSGVNNKDRANYTHDLTLGEAISATQCAIWQVAHGEILSFTNFVHNTAVYKFDEKNKAVEYATICNEDLLNYFSPLKQYNTLTKEQKQNINNNIAVLYNYLLSLDPVPATSKVVSPSSFIDLNDPVITANDDGTYDISVNVTVDVQMAAGDTLTLKADLKGYDGENQPTESLANGENTVILTIENIPAANINGKVTLAIYGEQTGNGVFLFDAEGERGSSQTMVGVDNSRLPVYAEVVAQEDRVLNFHKVTNTNPARPLEGIIFDIYPVNYTLDQYIRDPNGLPAPPTEAPSTLAEYTVITDKNGNASLNFTQHGLEDGIYLVAERKVPKIVAPIPPFYIIFPASFMQSSTDDYTITVEAKNELVDAPVLTGGITIKKVDAKDETVVLEGATFEVYRPATPEELAANEGSLSQIPGVTEKVVPVSFYLDEAMTEAKTEATTDANGTLSIYGLPYGKYYLLETQAPAGYNLPAKAVEITINGESVENSFVVKNVSGAILPETGGMGTGAFTFGGVVLVAFSILMLLDRKRKAIN